MKKSTDCASTFGACHIELVTFDDWLYAETDTDSFSPEAWRRSREGAFSKVISLVEHAQREGSVDTLIVADDNMHYRSMRYELFQLARDRGLAFMQLYVSCSLHIAKERNAQRTGSAHVPTASLERMHTVLEPPAPDRYTWEANSLVFDSSSLEVDDANIRYLCDKLWALWGPPPAPLPTEEELQRQREEGQQANAASYIHGLDLRTRQALSAAVSDAGACKARVAKELNEKRRLLLKEARELLVESAHGEPHQLQQCDARSPDSVGALGRVILEKLQILEAGFVAAAAACASGRGV